MRFNYFKSYALSLLIPSPEPAAFERLRPAGGARWGVKTLEGNTDVPNENDHGWRTGRSTGAQRLRPQQRHRSGERVIRTGRDHLGRAGDRHADDVGPGSRG